MAKGGSKVGGAGKYGGGMDNKDTTTTVRNANPLTEQISKGGGSFANEIMSTRDEMEAEYGSAVKDMKLYTATFGDPTVLGAYGDDTLYMAKKYVKNKNLTEAMKNAEASGFHPSIGNRTGAEAVASHEIGHRLGQIAAQKAGITEKDIVANAASKVNIKTENMAGYISKYARSNYGETIAEASADVFCNGKNASRASIAIMNEVKSILK